MTVPIVFVSKTMNGRPCDYVRHAMSVASRENEDVVLIGDKYNQSFCRGRFVDMNSYQKSIEEFEEHYVHLSTNPENIEMFCYSRWFALRDFMRDNNYQQALHLDTDVLYFANATEEAKRFTTLDCAISRRVSGHVSFWSLKGITKFCDYILEVYKNKEDYLFTLLRQEFAVMQHYGKQGGVCDMSLIEQFLKYSSKHLAVDHGGLSSHLYYDHIISHDEGFEFVDGRKVFTYKDGKPYSKHIRTGELKEFACIHFQGPNKPLMEYHADLSL